jgi:SAM-dependent methyltransferase
MSAAKRSLKRVAEALFGIEAAMAARWSSAAHSRLMRAQWSLPPVPAHFDHHIDLHHQWLRARNPLWLERGVFSLLALKGRDVLELACGDGFNARNFYSMKSRRVVGCDIDPQALATARRKNAAPNIEYVIADIRVALPAGRFDNIVWDFAFPLVQYFEPAEIDRILRLIRDHLTPEGVLSGYTLALEREPAATPGHYEFRRLEDLRAFLQPHFKRVVVFETLYPERRNLYFWASDGCLPMTPDWPHVRGL